MLMRIFAICHANGFLRTLKSGKRCVAPIGTLLLENLQQEWLNAMINHKECTIVLGTRDFKDNYDFVRDFCGERLPFGVADMIKFSDLFDGCDSETSFDGFFSDYVGFFRCTVFVAPNEAVNAFHQWQRLRRMWWRKFSPTPGRYSTTDQRSISEITQRVDVCSKFPWGSQIVEAMTMSTDKHPLLGEPEIQNKVGRKRVPSHYITSTIPISTMYFNTICDSYEELEFQNETRQYFRFHRKLAPYKIALSISNTLKASATEELNDLASYICKKLRGEGITTLLQPSILKRTFREQFEQFDHLGVPYTVVLNENTLKNGIADLRSRDTTLKEQVHVTELPKYVEELFKNY